MMKLINIGFGNMVSATRLVAIVSPESAPIRRIITKSKESNMLVDATYGRRSRSVLVTDSDHIILSPIQPETIANRLSSEDEEEEDDLHSSDEPDDFDFSNVDPNDFEEDEDDEEDDEKDEKDDKDED